MPQSRKSQVSLADTPYYHCISRCVRRAFLCGEDELTGRSYEHRRQWVEEQLLFLPQVFAIDVCAYAVMNNHTHVVLHIDKSQTDEWDTREVLTRWHKLYKGTLLTQRYVEGINLSDIELSTVEETASIYKQRLTSLSWFMQILNEGIARRANKEDECTGRFWEGRFKSQALLDEAALIACMAYVDLNPIRANIADKPETSDYTSIKRRIRVTLAVEPSDGLMPFIGSQTNFKGKGLGFELKDYIELVDITGRCIRDDKPGYINNELPSILARLDICESNWLLMSKSFTKVFHGAVGSEKAITTFAENQGRKRRCNLSTSRLFA